METWKRNVENNDELKLANMRESWPLRMVIELSKKILDKGVIKGSEVIYSQEDRKKLLLYCSKMEPMFTQIKRTPGMDVEPLERVINDLREKIYHFSKNTAKRSHQPLS